MTEKRYVYAESLVVALAFMEMKSTVEKRNDLNLI